MFGAASLNSVAKIGPSSSNLVRGATACAGEVTGDVAGIVEGILMLCSFIGAPPHVRLEQRLRRAVFKNRAAAWRARLLRAKPRAPISTLHGSATHLFSGMPEKISLTLSVNRSIRC